MTRKEFKGMTNGEVLDEVFGVEEVESLGNKIGFRLKGRKVGNCFPKDWWNAPYKKSEVENENR